MRGLPPRRLCWAIAAFFHYTTLVVGADQSGRLDLLVGTDGESACQLGQLIHQKCATQFPGLDKTPVASLCTCNDVFFNIWSACSYASGNNTLPIYNQWLGTCGNSSIDMAKSSVMTTETGALGISIPKWAMVGVPGNTTFDLQQAVVEVHSTESKPWTAVQIALPAAAAVVAALLTAVCLVARRRKNVKQEIKDYLYKLKPVPKVIPVNERQFGEWVIEQPLPNSQNGRAIPLQQHEAYRDEVPPPIHNRHSDSTVPGHPSIPSTGLLGSVIGFNHTTQNASVVPGGRVWPEGVIPRSPDRTYPFSLHPHQQQSGSNTRNTTPASSGKWRVRSVHVPKPWKSRPIQVRERKPGKGFRLDGSTEDSTSVGQQSARGHGDNPEDVRSSLDIRRHEDGVEDFFDEPLPMEEEDSEDEATNLMTDDQRTSYLEPGELAEYGRFSANAATVNSSSIDSHVRVIPPSTTSSDSPRNTMISRPSSRYLPPPIVPPIPRQPAPVPPAAPARVPLRDVLAMNNNPINFLTTQPILANQPSNLIRQMTPIQEIEIRSPSPSLSSLSGMTRRPSGGEARPLPLPNSPPHGQLSFGAGALGLAKSTSASSSSVFEEYSRESSTHAHLRQNSGDSVRSLRPLPTPGRNPSLSSLSNQQFFSHSREDLGSDYFSARGNSGQGSPYSGAHQRGLASDDSDDASFYVRSPPALPHSLLPSPPLGSPDRAMSPLGTNGRRPTH